MDPSIPSFLLGLMIRSLLLVLALGLCTAPGLLGQSAVLRGVDVYRSRVLTTSLLHQRYLALLDSLGHAVAQEDMEALGAGLGSLARQIRDAGDFAFLDLSPIQYFHGDTTVWYLTVDVVDSTDLGRLDFDPPPTGQVSGVEPLLEAWRDFEAEGWARRAFWTQSEPCPAFHCLFSFQDTALAGYQDRFRIGAEESVQTLERMLREDADEDDRATAAFLIAHLSDEARVVSALLGRLRDPSSLVRNNAVRVLAFMVRDLGSEAVPLEPFLKLMDGPTTTDRNKALVVLDGLARRTEYREAIRTRAGDRLLALLDLKQPNNRDFAYSVLKTISGEDFGADDHAAWRRWLDGIGRQTG